MSEGNPYEAPDRERPGALPRRGRLSDLRPGPGQHLAPSQSLVDEKALAVESAYSVALDTVIVAGREGRVTKAQAVRLTTTIEKTAAPSLRAAIRTANQSSLILALNDSPQHRRVGAVGVSSWTSPPS